MAKKQYATPVVRSHGAMTALTQQNQSGMFLDVGFGSGTPVSQITLS